MGLFSRTSQAEVENEDFDDTDLPSSTDINDNPFEADEPSLDFKSGRQAASSKGAYGVEEAIRLMKALPRDNNEVVVTVVKKTLESTNIKVQDIIDDANAREARIRDQHKRLEKEIKNLQEEITKRNQRISELLQDLKDTTDVRQRLQLALELDSGGGKAAENGKSPAAKAVAAPNSAKSAAKPLPKVETVDGGTKAEGSPGGTPGSAAIPSSQNPRN